MFFKLGFFAFGGPAAHIAIFHDEVVTRRKWLSEQEFLDLLGATNLIPGPNSTEMAIHIGYRYAGWPGLVIAGAGFILPATGIVLGLSWIYVSYGSTPQAGWLLYGIKPVVIAIIFQALWMLGRKAVRGPLTAIAGLLALWLYFIGVPPVPALLIGGFLVMVGENFNRFKKTDLAATLVPIGKISLAWPTLLATGAVPFNLGLLFLTFLKIGSVLYGSGYVLLAFLKTDFVERLGWLTESQLLDAVAVGQVTPGPVFTTATFIGYLLGGVPGGLVATLGIFLPSFVFVAISNPFIPRLRRSPWAAGLLNGINAASLGLMAAVTWQLTQTSLVDPLTVVLTLLSVVILLLFGINTTWLILAGGLVGLLRAIIL